MPANPEIDEFFERAKLSGANEQSLIGILVARGWPEKEVYKALAAHYERRTGIEIPRRGGAGTAAKDAFFYLLLFSTLATWTFSLGWLAFTLIEVWLADTLFSPAYAQAYTMSEIASALASIFVSFPIFLLVSRSIVREGRKHPETLDSPVRKWLTYIVLVIAALVFMGDLITALTYLLRGEITSRFLAKAFVVLVISGGVFFYYFGGLRRSETTKPDGRVNRDTGMAAVSAVAVIAIAALGFWRTGKPQTQRALRADGKRMQDLYGLSGQINLYWTRNHKLPEHLDQLPGAVIADAVTRQPYEYHVKEGSKYELCATFLLDSHVNDATRSPSRWSHSAGRHCFQVDATEAMDSPYAYYSP
jgi:Domain of unknown function (DUF5671)